MPRVQMKLGVNSREVGHITRDVAISTNHFVDPRSPVMGWVERVYSGGLSLFLNLTFVLVFTFFFQTKILSYYI